MNRIQEPLCPKEITEIVNNTTEYKTFYSEDISQIESLNANQNVNNGSSLETDMGNKRDSIADNNRITNIETMKNSVNSNSFGADLLKTDDEDSSSDNNDEDENDDSDETDEDDVNDEHYFEKLEARKLRLRTEVDDFINEIPRDKMR